MIGLSCVRDMRMSVTSTAGMSRRLAVTRPAVRTALLSVSMAGRSTSSVSNRISGSPATRPAQAQCGHLIGGLGTQLGGQLPAQLGLDGQLVLAPRRDLAIQLQVVDELQITGLGLVQVTLAPVDDGDEGRHHGSPQGQDDGELQQLDAIGEHQCGTGQNG